MSPLAPGLPRCCECAARRAPASIAVLVAAVAACGTELRPKAVPEIAHRGFRDDIPDAQRGNGVFRAAWWSADGELLVTSHHLANGLRVWNGADGALLANVDANPNDDELLVHSRRIVAHRRLWPKMELRCFEARTGEPIASVADDIDRPMALLGWTDGGESFVVSRPGWIEVWSTDELRPIRAVESPLPREMHRSYPALMAGSYSGARTMALSRAGDRLVVAIPIRDAQVRWSYALVDTLAMTVETIATPDGMADEGFASFALSHDGRRLALGTRRGAWFVDLGTRAWGPFVAGEHKRNAYLAPMGFSADGARLVALGDQLQVSVLDVAHGKLLGRYEPDFDDWEGVFRLSPDGSRVALYHFASDTLEILDGRDASRVGWVCAYFCNVRHAPVQVHFAFNADGRTLAASHRYGAALWAADEDRLIAPLADVTLKPLPHR